MPPHLHPRSKTTTSLFTTTLLLSFLVVATPHLLPCPVDRRTLADSSDPTAMTDPSQAQRRRRRRIQRDEADGETSNEATSAARRERRARTEDWDVPARKRECPVPKPGGLIGQVLGVRTEEGEGSGVRAEVERARRRTSEE